MKKLFLLFATCHLLLTSAFSQNIQWQNTIGGSNFEGLYSISPTIDGGYICGGWSNSGISGDKTENSQGNYDYWVIKLDATGNIQWQNTIGGNSYDWLYSLSQTADGGYICGGWSRSNVSGDKTENSLGIDDYWVVKLDSFGSIQWQNTIGGNDVDYLQSIVQTSDGGYICGGWSLSNVSGDKTENSLGVEDYWVVKLDAFGSIQWQNTIGGSNEDALYSISQTIDGGYICGGSSASNISGDKTENSLGDFDNWVVKLDVSGNLQWQNTIGGDTIDFLYSISQTIDGGFILGGYSNSNISGDKTENCLGLYDYWVIKLDAFGAIQWQNTIGGSYGELLFSIIQTSDGGYICGGFSESNISGDKTENSLGLTDYWVVKLDSSGNIQWQNTIGGSDDDGLLSISQSIDGGYICGGFSQSNISGDKIENCMGIRDCWIVKLNASGSIQWQNTIGGNNLDELYSISQTADSGYICAAFSNSNISGDKTENCLGLTDYWAVKLNASGNIQWQNTIGGNSDEPLLSITQTTDGGYICGGYSRSNISGDKVENSWNNSYDYWIVKINDTTITTSISNLQPPASNFQIFPNPANEDVTINWGQGTSVGGQVKVYDLFGREVFQKNLDTNVLILDTKILSKGVYVVEVIPSTREGNTIYRSKLVKE